MLYVVRSVCILASDEYSKLSDEGNFSRRNHFRCRKPLWLHFASRHRGHFVKFFVRNSLESRVIVTGTTTTSVNLRERWWNVCPRIASDCHRALSSGIFLSKTELTSAALSHTIISIIFSFLLSRVSSFLFSSLFFSLLFVLRCVLFLKNHKMRRKTSSFYRLSIHNTSVDTHPHGLLLIHPTTLFLSLFIPTIICCFETFTKHHFIQDKILKQYPIVLIL